MSMGLDKERNTALRRLWPETRWVGERLDGVLRDQRGFIIILRLFWAYASELCCLDYNLGQYQPQDTLSVSVSDIYPKKHSGYFYGER